MASIVPVVEHCKQNKVPLFLAAVDVNKAYDSVSRTALQRILQHMGLLDNRFI